MTKTEIIKETVEYYSTHPRSINELEQCVYKSPEGNLCAFSRCCTPEGVEELSKYHEGAGVSSSWSLTTLLKEQYRGHDAFFWHDVQRIHDNSENWKDGQLTNNGKEHVNMLLDKYAEG